MTTSFLKAINNVGTTVGSPYTPGSLQLTVVDASGFIVFPVAVSIRRGYVPITILKATGVNNNVLTISGPVDVGSADVPLLVGDIVEVNVIAKHINDISTAVNTLELASPIGIGDILTRLTNDEALIATDEANISVLFGDILIINTALSSKANDNAVVHLTGDETIAGTKKFSSTISGSISGTASSITGNIPESQVTGLTTDLANIVQGTKVIRFFLGLGQAPATGVEITIPEVHTSNGTYSKFYIYAGTNPTSNGAFTVDLLKNGTSIFASPQAVTANTTGVIAGQAFTTTTFAAGDTLNVSMSNVGTAVRNIGIYIETHN
jgi:hypothetical protein